MEKIRHLAGLTVKKKNRSGKNIPSSYELVKVLFTDDEREYYILHEPAFKKTGIVKFLTLEEAEDIFFRSLRINGENLKAGGYRRGFFTLPRIKITKEQWEKKS